MTAATELFEAVKVAYDSAGLITLTNIRDRTGTTIDETVGDNTAQSVIDLWPAWANVAYDSTNALHVEVAIEGVIALLWRRGGTATEIEKVKWDQVFGDDGMISKVKDTGPRGRKGPSSNSNVTQHSGLLSNGARRRPWADVISLPHGIMPLSRSASSDV